jgi:serine-type D-Ala-D-Ala carboxypeptidase (penicillin-binding protein 5/6)
VAPPIDATAAVLEDLDTGQVLFARHGDDQRSLASTTKIMTALVVLSRFEPGTVVEVGPDAAEEGSAGAGFSELGLKLGEHITVEQLLYALMLQSSNDAAVALAEGLDGSTEAFVASMNRKARAMGLHDTRFFSPSGLDDRGHSTARELAAITRKAFRDVLFARIVATKFHDIPSPSGRPRRVQNRNALLWLYRGAIGGKTGYTSAAGFCLVAAAERGGRRLLAVVLGDPTGNDTFDDAAALLNFGFRGFRRATLARDGEPLAPLPVGTGTLPVRAGSDLSPLLPAGRAQRVRRVVRVRPGLELPLAGGTRVGSVTFVLGGRALGRVPMVVPPSAQTLSPLRRPTTRPPGSPWFARGAGAVVTFTLRAFWSLFG